MEEMIHQVAGEAISVSIIRPSSVYGPREEDYFYTIFKIAAKGIIPYYRERLRANRFRWCTSGTLLKAACLPPLDRTPGVQTWFTAVSADTPGNEIAEATHNGFRQKAYQNSCS